MDTDMAPRASAPDAAREGENEPARAHVLALINQKGGVGKSTTAVNLGCALAERGKKVLLLDLDAQASMTEGMGVYLGDGDRDQSMYSVMLEERDLGDILCEWDVGEGLVALAPAHEAMSGLEAYLVGQLGYEHTLSGALEQVSGYYDFVLVDCGPSLGALSANAATAADYLLIPVSTQRYSLNGTRRLMRFFDRAQRSVNTELKVLGILLTQVDSRTRGSAEVAKQLQDAMPSRGHRVFETQIRINTTLAEVPGQALSVLEYDPGSRGAEDYRSLAKEVLASVRTP